MKQLLTLLLLVLVMSAQAQLTNEEKALALLAAFESGDTTVLDYVSDEQYIQHNLNFPDGKAVLEGFFTGVPTGITVNTVRSFTDGDFVILHSVYGGNWNNGTPQVALDVFRFKEGLIVEHWDNLGNVVDDMDGTSQTDGALTPALDSTETEANRQLITNMAEDLFIEGNWSRYPSYFDTTSAYVQHSVGVGPDASGILGILANIPEGIGFYTDIRFVHVLGNFALTMAEGPDFTGQDSVGTYAYFDLFRIDQGKILEHWDVIQLIPDSSMWANDNGKWGLDNEEKALALIAAFETGDTTALAYVSDEQYIQHNLAFPDGKGVLEGLLTGVPTGFTTATARIFSDGDQVIMHNVYGGTWNNGVPQVAFDVFRFEEGLIVEHWDNLGDIVDDMDGTSQTDGALTPTTDFIQTDTNRALITNMAQELFIDGIWSNYANYFDTSATYVQHSVGVGPDATGILNIIGGIPDGVGFYTSIEFVYVQGNFALTLAQGPDFTGQDTVGTYAYYDLFRIDQGKIVEHWDVIQLIPPQDEWANNNGKWGSDAITSIQNLIDTDMRMYPNPVKDVLQIDSQDFAGKQEVRIWNHSGRLIKEFKQIEIPASLDVSFLPQGFYLMEVLDPKRKLRSTMKIIKN